MTTRYRLANGLTVVFERQTHAPVVAFQVWVKVGSADETLEEIGLAHLHEHMLFKGTARRGLGEIARSIEAHGGEVNAWTSFDQTVYHVVMASRHAWTGLDVLADAVRNSAFEAAELTREIEVVCEEIKRSLDMPSRRASRSLFGEAFRTHPYGRPVIGFEPNVRSHTRERVLGFFEKYYQPANIVLSCVGDFDEATLRAQVDEKFGGDWARGVLPPFARPMEADWAATRINVTPDDAKDAHVHLAFQIPGVAHHDTAALDVLAMVLGQGDASRLSMEVKRKRSLVRDVNAWAWTPRERGLFAASIVCQGEHVANALRETARVLKDFTRELPGRDEVETVKALIEAEAIYQRETVQGLARKLGYYESMAGGLEREASYYEAVSQVTPQQLVEVATRYFRFDRALVTALVPRSHTITEQDLGEVLATLATETPPRSTDSRAPAEAGSTRLQLNPSRKPARPAVVVERLPNGAQLVVKEERSVPLFAMRASFLGGTRYETPENNGITTLLARCLTRGTTSRDAETISRQIDSLAGSLSALGGRNSLSLRGEFLSRHFEPAVDLFIDVLRRPSFPEDEVARERALVLQDIASRDDRPSSIAFELFAKTLWKAHPYRLSSLGERTSVEGLRADQLHEWHRRFLDPSQLTWCVVGDVDADVVLARAHEAFATSTSASPPPSMPAEPEWSGPREIKHTLQKAQSHLVLGFRGARVADPWRRSLEVLQTILSGQSGRLFLELRDKRSMAYSVSASVMEGVDPGSFSVYMGTSPDKVDAALRGIRDELDRVRTELVTDAELSRAKEHLIGTQSIGLQRNGARAGVMGLDACYGLPAEHYLTYADEIAAVSAHTVRDAAARVIDDARSALAIVGP